MFFSRVCMVFLCFWLCVGVVAGKARAVEPDCSGQWIGGYLGSKLEATVEQDGGRIKGVAYVTPFAGDQDAYHFSGEIQDGRIRAAHFSGHVFEGKLLPTGEIEGTLTTAKSKHRIDLVARRPQSE